MIGLNLNAQICDTDLDSESAIKLSKLDSAYSFNLPYLKENFFKEWKDISKNKLTEKNTTDSIKSAIEYFLSDIYYPDTDSHRYYMDYNIYDSTKNSVEKRKIQYNGCFIDADYFIVQTQIQYFIYQDSIFKKLTRYEKSYEADSIINDLYPDLKFLDKSILYLTEEYNSILNWFLMCPLPKTRESKEESNRKRVYLQPEIELSKSHDGWFFHYITFPEITYVLFNTEMNRAKVYFRTSFNTGGYSKYEKVNHIWRRVEYQREKWIQ